MTTPHWNKKLSSSFLSWCDVMLIRMFNTDGPLRAWICCHCSPNLCSWNCSVRHYFRVIGRYFCILACYIRDAKTKGLQQGSICMYGDRAGSISFFLPCCLQMVWTMGCFALAGLCWANDQEGCFWYWLDRFDRLSLPLFARCKQVPLRPHLTKFAPSPEEHRRSLGNMA